MYQLFELTEKVCDCPVGVPFTNAPLAPIDDIDVNIIHNILKKYVPERAWIYRISIAADASVIASRVEPVKTKGARP